MASTSSSFKQYPQLDGKYEDVVSDAKRFMETLEKLHSTMGTKFMIPIIGGKELDLHRLFQEVTSRGGIEKILRDRRWKEITAVFNFPSTATNASFVLRKYYYSLLHHYEQIYYFKARGFTPVGDDDLQRSLRKHATASQVEPQSQSPPSEFEATVLPQAPTIETELPGARVSNQPTLFSGTPVIGVIDGKFESGYLVTVTIGSEKLKGVLYQAPPQSQPWQSLERAHHQTLLSSNSNANNSNSAAAGTTINPGVHRRKRRKKSEIKRRDPAHPKPNRSGYNFFFAEQHARLKPLHPGKDREISRMIGELWNKLSESERVVYQEKAVLDKERYRVEMESYRERLRTGQVISDAVPLRQRFPEQDISSVVGADAKTDEAEGEDSPQTMDNESSLSEFEDDGAPEEDQEVAVGVEVETEEGSVPRKTEESPEKSEVEIREVDFGIEEAKEEQTTLN